MAPRVRDDLRDLEPYDPDMREVEVMLSANENSFGLPEPVRAEMARRLSQVPANRYPEATCRRLRALLGEKWGVPAAQVVVGNGGDELIFNLLLAFGGAGRTMIDLTPTFSAYALYAQLTATAVVNVARKDDFSVDEQALLAAAPDADIVFLTTPNNPSGNTTSPDFVRRLADATDALIVVDEAYGDFAPAEASCIALTGEYKNVCVLKTLSKAYALAGARIGFVLAPRPIADALLAVRQPYSVSRFDQVAAETVVELSDQLIGARDALVQGRDELFTRLRELAADLACVHGRQMLAVYPSAANFILVRVLDEDALPGACEVHERLAGDCSILVRNFSRAPGLAGCLRVTVGTPAENARLMDALRRIFAANKQKER